VLNDTKVYPCRLLAKKQSGGKAEIFLLAEKERNLWETLVKGGSGIGKKLLLDAGVEAEIVEQGPDCVSTVRFHTQDDIRSMLSSLGKIPLPPYIRRDATDTDKERYQTVYAAHEGAVAAPTAGLHFTQELLQQLTETGIECATITLHVGPGTFQPVRVDKIVEHKMLPEMYQISDKAAAQINLAKAEGRRVIAVGTTSVRTLETAAVRTGNVTSGDGASELFIYPGYRFRVIDGLITNFHLPKSTLLMLVAAFAGRGQILAAYQAAVAERYRFYSYGDAMVIL
jgi:S-adenosylmethionine:tRNA ribosyltransferase-isomerase